MAKHVFRPIHGIVLLDKALGVSSNKALQQARFVFNAEKAGHTGSLDPLASGMLPVCFGEATKVSGMLLDASKTYRTTATLGYISTTGDAEGEKLNPRPIPSLDDQALNTVLNRFRGAISQIPPMYSALKKDGQPLYKLARQGIELERKPRSVTIHSLTVLARTNTEIELEVCCSKGTYIRSLVEDLGEALGCGAYVSALHRVSVDPFADYPMYSLDALQTLSEQGDAALLDILLPMDTALQHVPRLDASAEWVSRLQCGQRIRIDYTTNAEILRLYTPEGQFIGLGQINDGLLSSKRLLAY